MSSRIKLNVHVLVFNAENTVLLWVKLTEDVFCFMGFVHQLAPEQGVQSMDQSTSVKRRCDEEATRVVEENNATMGLYVVQSINILIKVVL